MNTASRAFTPTNSSFKRSILPLTHPVIGSSVAYTTKKVTETPPPPQQKSFRLPIPARRMLRSLPPLSAPHAAPHTFALADTHLHQHALSLPTLLFPT